MKSGKYRILFLGGGTRVTHLEYFKKYFMAYTTDIDPLAPTRQVAQEFFLTPPFSSEQFPHRLVKIIKQEKIDLVIPASHHSLPALDRSRLLVKQAGAFPLISNSRAIEISLDKQKTFNFFQENNIPGPKRFGPQHPRFPLFIKPRKGAGTKLSFKVANRKELAFFQSYVPQPFIQEYCEGQEYTIDVFSDLSGKAISIVPRKRIEARNGEIVKGVTEKNKTLIKYAKKIAETLQTIGPICIQCFKVKDSYFFTEINCRFGGGVTLSMKAGANFAKFLFEILSGKKLSYYEGWKEALYFSRAYRDFYFYETDLGTL